MNRLLTRRETLRLALVGGIGLGLAGIRAGSRGSDPVAQTRWMLRRAGRLLTARKSTVAVMPALSYQQDLLAALRRGWDLAPGPPVRGRKVLLKPNLVGMVQGPPANTNAAVVEAAIALFRELGAAEVLVGEGMAFVRDPMPVVTANGLAAVLQRTGTRFVDLNHDNLMEMPVAGGYTAMRTLSLPRTVVAADVIISLPKMKTHHWAGLSLSLKNLFGLIPGSRYGWPKNALHVAGLDLMVLELCETVRPAFAIVDGIVGMEGDGPLYGGAVPSGVLVMGSDLVAVDATCARLMGFDPLATPYVSAAETVGLGWAASDRVDALGAGVAGLTRKYAPPPSL
jgi:uncharacterized protein (DUF362 family)